MFILISLFAILRLLFLFVLFTFLWRVIRRWLGQMVQDRSPEGYRPEAPHGRAISGKTVRDPVCGTHVAVELAIPGPRHGAPVYFCSEECKQNYHPTKA